MAKRKRSRAASNSASTGSGLNVGLIAAAVVAVTIVAAGGFFLMAGNSEAELQVGQPLSTAQREMQAVAFLPVAPEVGALAPNFILPDTTGKQVSLSDFQGQPVVVTFFHTWWPVCNANAPEFRAAEEKFGDQLVMLHVDQEEPQQAVERFVEQYELVSPFLMDPDGEIGRLYRLRGTPTTFFINSDGVVQNFQPGFVTLDWIEQNLNQAL